MIRLVCQKCKKVWYTANTAEDQICSECGGKLKEESMLQNSQTGKQRDIK